MRSPQKQPYRTYKKTHRLKCRINQKATNFVNPKATKNFIIKKKIKVTHEYQLGQIKALLCQQTGTEEKQACVNIQHHHWKRIILLLTQPNGTPDKKQTERQTELNKVTKEAKTNWENN